MIVNYFGERCFRLQSGERSILTDPTSNRLKADIVLKTKVATTLSGALPGEAAFPGEYEMGGIQIQGFPAESDSNDKHIATIYLVRWEEMSFVFLGHITKAPQAEWISKIGEPDLLIMPLDGDDFLSPKEAAQVVKELTPRVVVTGATKNMSEVLKILGQKADPIDKFVFKKKDLEQEKRSVVVLKSV